MNDQDMNTVRVWVAAWRGSEFRDLLKEKAGRKKIIDHLDNRLPQFMYYTYTVDGGGETVLMMERKTIPNRVEVAPLPGAWSPGELSARIHANVSEALFLMGVRDSEVTVSVYSATGFTTGPAKESILDVIARAALDDTSLSSLDDC